MEHHTNTTRPPLNPATLRERLSEISGPQFWRSLEELADTEEFQKFLEDEFPQQARPLRAEMDRRQFVILAGASLALAGLSGCRFLPQKKIVPYVRQPEEIVPGKPLFYATAATLGGYATGIVVTSQMGRPTKIEGNPDHPASLGRASSLTQAALLDLYDPDRSRTVMNRNLPGQTAMISTWDNFFGAARTTLAEIKKSQGAGLRILTETVTSPTLAEQIHTLLNQYPQAQWHQYSPVTRDNVRAGAVAAFGEPVNTIYRFDRADRILALDADFLLNIPGDVRYAYDFAQKRRVRKNRREMNRLYAVESTPSLTGSIADHTLPLRASEIGPFAQAVAKALGVDVPGAVDAPSGVPPEWIPALVRDLKDPKYAGASIVLAGEHQPPAVHALAHAMNEILGNVGKTVFYTEPVEAQPISQADSLRRLVSDMQAGSVTMLLIVGGNPVYNSPVDLGFATHLTKVPFRAHLALHEDETSALCQWHLPAAHFLEAWSDARAYDGTVSIVQPLIQPLYDNKSAHEVLAAMLSRPQGGFEIVRGYWQQRRPSGEFERQWEKWLHDGQIPQSEAPLKTVRFKGAAALPPVLAPETGMELQFRPDPTVYDGSFANNGWLQELPKPITKLVWDNAVIISPATAIRLKFAPENSPEKASELQVKVAFKGHEVLGALYVLPGHPDNAVTLHLGYGRKEGGGVAVDKGINAYLLRTMDALDSGAGVTLTPSGERYQLVATHMHSSMDMAGRAPVLAGVIEQFDELDKAKRRAEREAEEYAGEPAGGKHGANGTGPDAGKTNEEGISLWSGPHDDYKGHAWAMSIDNNVCIGCGACVTACQAENNIPVVGKDQVSRGREMHWIRIDRYFSRRNGKTDMSNPTTYFQPVPCMQCEKAPCEPVCPVAATVHSHEGLNQMIYNRCVGTRYCSNNCPYKVRRFNFLNYANHHETPVLKLLNNPEVTVRGRGVMEKCTYCVQRINNARIEAKKQDRAIKDGEVRTACQQTCPTDAIVFGDLRDKESAVAKWKAEPHDYSLLEELNTRPRTTYLAKLRNPNPELERETNRASR